MEQFAIEMLYFSQQGETEAATPEHRIWPTDIVESKTFEEARIRNGAGFKI